MLRRRYIKLEKMYHLNRCLPLFTLGNEMNIAILDLKIFKNKDINSTKIEVQSVINGNNFNNENNNYIKIERIKKTIFAETRYTDGNNALK